MSGRVWGGQEQATTINDRQDESQKENKKEVK